MKLYFITPIICYLVGAGANASFNLAEWNPDGRGVCFIAAGLCLMCLLMIDYLNGD